MADKLARPKTILAKVSTMEVTNVQSTAVQLAAPTTVNKVQLPPALKQAVQAVNDTKLFGQDSELSFMIDRETKRLIVRLVDKDSGKVLRQIPAEEILRLAEDMPKQQASGVYA